MSYLLVQADARRIPLPDRSVDLVFGSPPYLEARLYLEDGRDLGIARDCRAWVEWMLAVSREAVRVSRGAVLWVVAGSTKDRNYQPGPEGLAWRWYESGGMQECPCYWRRSGISGSGGDQWFRKDVEYVLCFKRDGKFPWSDNTAMGKPCKYETGGTMSSRTEDGRRINAKKGRRLDERGSRRPNGKIKTIGYTKPEIANPGNLIDTGAAGGGNLGSGYAHENEAPFPEDLAEWFIRSLCPPGGTCLDPFSGSGTTVAVAERLGRHGVGMDLRRSQADLAARRITRPHCPVARSGCVEHHPLFTERTS